MEAEDVTYICRVNIKNLLENFQNFDRSGNSRIDVLAGEILFYGRLNQKKKRKKKDNNRQVECLLLSSL